MNKPMLAGVAELEKLRFPLSVSPKLDGVRAITSPEVLLSRALKPIPNREVQAFFSGLPSGLDGELILGEPTAEDVYRKTVSFVMTKETEEGPLDHLTYYLFDVQTDGTFTERRAKLESIYANLGNVGISVALVPERIVYNLEELEAVEREYVELGYEGAMLRSLDGPYKHGRSTVREGFLLKLKRFADSEARIVEVVELMHNDNEAETNELGRTKRSHKKEGMRAAGTMGALLVEDVQSGVRFEIGTGFTAAERAYFWDDRFRLARLPLIKYKHFPVGAKDKPRHPVYLGWRAEADR